MIAEKERAIVLAAHELFLRDGFAVASMDAIARLAGVSVKTIYSHFANKNELFSKVLIAACTDHLLSSEAPSDDDLEKQFGWFRDYTQKGLTEAGREYLKHLLSEEQLALYRVVTRDADRFRELGRQYQANIARGRTGILIAYLRNVARAGTGSEEAAALNASVYEALLRAGIFEEALHGLIKVESDAIGKQCRKSSGLMWSFLSSGRSLTARSSGKKP